MNDNDMCILKEEINEKINNFYGLIINSNLKENEKNDIINKLKKLKANINISDNVSIINEMIVANNFIKKMEDLIREC